MCGGASVAEVLRDLWRKVEKFGWASVGVIPDQEIPWLTYTIGFSKRFPECPEFAVSGIPGVAAQAVFRGMFDRMASGEIRHDEPGFSEQLLEGYPTLLIPVTMQTAREHFTTASRVLGDTPRYVQIVWPDKEHRWPWQPGYDSAPQKLYGIKMQ